MFTNNEYFIALCREL